MSLGLKALHPFDCESSLSVCSSALLSDKGVKPNKNIFMSAGEIET